MVAENLRSPACDQTTSGMCPTHVVESYPMTSMLCLVGLGMGVGLLLGQAVAAPLAHRIWHEDTLTEKITGQIRDAVKRAVPEGLARHFS